MTVCFHASFVSCWLGIGRTGPKPAPSPDSQAHWTELPATFLASLDKQAQAGTFVFRGIQFFDVGLAVFLGKYDFLARHLVKYTPELAAASPEQLRQMFKDRLRPVRL